MLSCNHAEGAPQCGVCSVLPCLPLFDMQMAEWWYESGEKKLAAPTAYPPPPPPPLPQVRPDNVRFYRLRS